MDDQAQRAYPQETESLCPVCLKKIAAVRRLQGDEVLLVKECQDHGPFSTVIWRGQPALADWRRPKPAVHPELCYGSVERGCPYDCGLCDDHEQLPCSVLLEVTERCNLSCAVCFADAGRAHHPGEDPSLETITGLLRRSMAAAGPSNLQLSGGEPTLRDDLPAIVEIARNIGYSFIQVNSNGLRLASDLEYLKRLQAAGLSSVFLQFDGVDDKVYRALRGRSLLNRKLRAIDNCRRIGLGVVLVPTLVKGVNTDSVGAIVRQALQLAPTVRGVHFQPVSYFGRFPARRGGQGRFTLPELMRGLEEQTGGLVKVGDFSPPGCEHAHCSCHATFMYSAQGTLRPVGGADSQSCCLEEEGATGVRRTVESFSRRWKLPSAAAPYYSRPPLAEPGAGNGNDAPQATRVEGPLDLDAFLREAATRSFTISAMAFQDAENIDLERLKGCCISVVSAEGKLIPFCAYNLTGRDGRTLYRRPRISESL